jgi:hypothetical protein
VARALHVGVAIPVLSEVYRSLLIAMTLAYAIDLKATRAPSILRAYVAELFAGPALYALLPACGTLYAFAGFPWNPARPPLATTVLSGDPNAVPSLHMATAIVLVFFAPNVVSRLLFVLYAVAIAISTLTTGEHYVVDLIIAVPFACFAASFAQGRIGSAAGSLATVGAWILAIRVTPDVLVLHPVLLRLAGALTIAVGINRGARFWRAMRRPAEGGRAEVVEKHCRKLVAVDTAAAS